MQRIQDNNQLRSSHKEVNSNRKKSISLHHLANITLFIAVFIGIWQLVYVLYIWPEVSLPSPVKVGESFVGMFGNLTLITSIGRSFVWHALIGAEILIAASVGLGHVLLVGREFQLMDQVIASMITIFAIGLLFDRVLFSKLEERVRERWGLDQGVER